MKKTIKLPEWTDERNIYIFAGIELVIKRDLGEWMVKTERCNKCGKCCIAVKCKHLILRANEWLCKFDANRPFNCSVYEGLADYCNIKWKKL